MLTVSDMTRAKTSVSRASYGAQPQPKVWYIPLEVCFEVVVKRGLHKYSAELNAAVPRPKPIFQIPWMLPQILMEIRDSQDPPRKPLPSL